MTEHENKNQEEETTLEQLESLYQDCNQLQEENKFEFTVPWYIQNRPEITNFAVKLIDNLRTHRNVIVQAEVKSGKRICTQVHGLLKQDNEIVWYTASFYQKQMEPDLEELRKHNIEVGKLNTAKQIDEIIKKIEKYAQEGKENIIYFDECDYGTGLGSQYHKFRKKLKKLKVDQTKIKHIYVSATPYEVICSPLFSKAKLMVFEPSPKYFGPKQSLEHDLVEEPIDFLTYSKRLKRYILSPEFASLIKKYGLNEEGKKLVITRASKGRKVNGKIISEQKIIKKDKNIQDMIKTLLGGKEKCVIDFLDSEQENNMLWTDRKQSLADSNKKHLVFINKMAERSVNIQCHEYLWAWFEPKTEPGKGNYATKAQNAFRVVHHVDKVGDCYGIRIYADKNIFKLAAGMITTSEYIEKSGPLSGRTVSKRKIVHSMNKNVHVKGTIQEISNVSKELVQPRFVNEQGIVTVNNLSANKEYDFAEHILQGKPTDLPILVDKASPAWPQSFQRLCKEMPWVIGSYYFKERQSIIEYDVETVKSVYNDRKIS